MSSIVTKSSHFVEAQTVTLRHMQNDNDKQSSTTLYANKQSFWSYLSSFFTGWVSKDFIENELRAAFKRPTLPAVSIKEIFAKGGLKDLGEGLKNAKVWKELAKEGGIHGASIIPGAVLGYLALNPVVALIKGNVVSVHEGKVSGDGYKIQVSDAEVRGTLASTEQQQQK